MCIWILEVDDLKSVPRILIRRLRVPFCQSPKLLKHLSECFWGAFLAVLHALANMPLYSKLVLKIDLLLLL